MAGYIKYRKGVPFDDHHTMSTATDVIRCPRCLADAVSHNDLFRCPDCAWSFNAPAD